MPGAQRLRFDLACVVCNVRGQYHHLCSAINNSCSTQRWGSWGLQMTLPGRAF